MVEKLILDGYFDVHATKNSALSTLLFHCLPAYFSCVIARFSGDFYMKKEDIITLQRLTNRLETTDKPFGNHLEATYFQIVNIKG